MKQSKKIQSMVIEFTNSSFSNLQKIAPIIFAILILGLLSILFGLVAVTADPIIVALAGSSLVGGVLLFKPDWIVSIITVLGLLVAGMLPLYFESIASKVAWGLSILGFLLLLMALAKFITKDELSKKTPEFIYAALAFIALTIIGAVASRNSFPEFIGGFKRYFQVWGLMFALAWCSFSDNHIKRWKKIFFWVACLQLPFVLFELFHIVPIRKSLELSIPGLVAVDALAGTFGTSLTGGGANSAMAVFLVAMLAVVIARFNEGLLSLSMTIMLVILMATPLFLGETKAVMAWLPLMVLVLYRKELVRRPAVGILGITLGSLTTLAVAQAYLTITGDKSLEDMVYNIIGYNYYGKYSNGILLNRTTVLSFWFNNQGLHDPVGFLFGNGIGSAHASTGHLDLRYTNYGIGLTAVSSLLWEVGVLGISLFALILLLAWRCSAMLQKHSVIPYVRADALAIQVFIALFCGFTLLRNDALETLTFQITFTGMLGYLAWLHSQYIPVSGKT